jgi:DNA polymerase-1
MGPDRMIRDGVDPDMAYGFDNGMKAAFPVLCDWREGIRAIAAAGGILDNGFGRRMRADPRHAHTVAPALMGQGGARDIMGQCLLQIDPALRPYMVLQVHDEVILDVPEGDAGEAAAEVRRAMTWTWRDVPILCDQAGPGRSWGELSGDK